MDDHSVTRKIRNSVQWIYHCRSQSLAVQSPDSEALLGEFIHSQNYR
jgi:hypothetical protein